MLQYTLYPAVWVSGLPVVIILVLRSYLLVFILTRDITIFMIFKIISNETPIRIIGYHYFENHIVNTE